VYFVSALRSTLGSSHWFVHPTRAQRLHFQSTVTIFQLHNAMFVNAKAEVL
jgi:hypothetical protein